MIKAIIILSILVLILAILLWQAWRKISQLSFSQKSLSSRYGKTVEQFLPFLFDYPYNPETFRFLGAPIDGIQFEDDQIILLEFKTAKSKMNEKQRHIRQLVEEGKVIFQEIKID